MRTEPSTASKNQEDLWQWAERREMPLPSKANATERISQAYANVRHQRFSRALTWCQNVFKNPKRR